MGFCMGNWGYNPCKWSYGPLLIAGFAGAHFVPRYKVPAVTLSGSIKTFVYLPIQSYTWMVDVHGYFRR